MKRETIYNLIFLVVVLAFVIPGGIALFKARLKPSAPSMFQPDFAHHQKQPVYIDFHDQRKADGSSRVAPTTTAQWVQYQSKQLFNPQMRKYIHWFKGLASQKHRFEVPAIITSNETGTLMAVIVWDPKITKPTFVLGQDTMAAVGTFVWDVPPMIRQDLKRAGSSYVPSKVMAYMLQSSETAPENTLVVSYKGEENQTISDVLKIPIMSDAEYTGGQTPTSASSQPATSPQ